MSSGRIKSQANIEKENKIIELLNQGMSYRMICKQLNVYMNDVWRAKTQNNVVSETKITMRVIKEPKEPVRKKHERITSHYPFSNKKQDEIFFNGAF